MKTSLTKREQEIADIWLGWVLDGTFEYEASNSWVTWGDKATITEQVTHERLCKELDDRQSPSWDKCWSYVYKTYASIPLIQALA